MATPSLRYVSPPGDHQPNLEPEPVVIFDLPSGGSTAWVDITGVPAPLTSAAAAGTPSIRAIGTTPTTAKAGDYQPTWAQVTAKPATVSALPASLGTAGQVLRVNAAGTALEWYTPA